MKNISIIGSTGSIGTQVLNVVRRNPEKFNIVALVANSNLDLLLKQVKEFQPLYVGIANENLYEKARQCIPKKISVECGEKCLVDAATLINADTVVVSVVGMCGLPCVLAAVNAGKNVALANKESLVAGGELVMAAAKKSGSKILPIDSEHSAVWQCLHSGRKEDLKRIILTASGGRYYGKALSELKDITAEQAVNHPTWNMGKKISVDSATMMNKALEIIEAYWLFDTDKIDYIIHPQSIVHSMVEFKDGAVIAQMSLPNMEIPIQLAIAYPERLACNIANFNFDIALEFFPPNEKVFFFPQLAKEAIKNGNGFACALNSANEAAVQLFLQSKIKFTQIFEIVEKEFLNFNPQKIETLDEIMCIHKNITEKLMREYK